MLTVKQVAAALGIDERSVRDKLMLGTLKGTKKTVGQRDQWFVHQRDLDAELARRGLNPINQPREASGAEARVTGHSLNFSPTEPSLAGSEAQVVVEQAPADISVDAEEVIAEFSDRTDTEQAPDRTERSGLWTDDLEKKMQETAEAFMRPLIERVEILTREAMEKDRVIEEQREQLRLLPDLESQKAKLLSDIEAERKASEIQFAKAAEKEAEARALEEENEKLKQKAEEAVLSAAKLEQLEREIQQLKQPKPSFWKRLFMPGGQEG